jgi:predicted amidophosphoribosyltransferase
MGDITLSVTYELKEKEKTCPMCAESVKYGAKICKHCGHQFTQTTNKEKKEEIISDEFLFIQKLEDLKATIKDDEMIVEVKDTKELKIIKKSEYEASKELHLKINYKIVFKNENL